MKKFIDIIIKCFIIFADACAAGFLLGVAVVIMCYYTGLIVSSNIIGYLIGNLIGGVLCGLFYLIEEFFRKKLIQNIFNK